MIAVRMATPSPWCQSRLPLGKLVLRTQVWSGEGLGGAAPVNCGLGHMLAVLGAAVHPGFCMCPVACPLLLSPLRHGRPPTAPLGSGFWGLSCTPLRGLGISGCCPGHQL